MFVVCPFLNVDYVLEHWHISDTNGDYVGQIEVSDISEFGGDGASFTVVYRS